MSPNLGFSLRIVFSDECVFHFSIFLNSQNTNIFGVEKPRGIQQYELHNEKVAVWFAMHVNGLAGPYFLNDETVTEVDNHLVLGTYMRFKSEKLLQSAVSKQDGARPLTKRPVGFLFGQILRKSSFEGYGKTG